MNCMLMRIKSFPCHWFNTYSRYQTKAWGISEIANTTRWAQKERMFDTVSDEYLVTIFCLTQAMVTLRVERRWGGVPMTYNF